MRLKKKKEKWKERKWETVSVLESVGVRVNTVRQTLTGLMPASLRVAPALLPQAAYVWSMFDPCTSFILVSHPYCLKHSFILKTPFFWIHSLAFFKHEKQDHDEILGCNIIKKHNNMKSVKDILYAIVWCIRYNQRRSLGLLCLSWSSLRILIIDHVRSQSLDAFCTAYTQLIPSFHPINNPHDISTESAQCVGK